MSGIFRGILHGASAVKNWIAQATPKTGAQFGGGTDAATRASMAQGMGTGQGSEHGPDATTRASMARGMGTRQAPAGPSSSGVMSPFIRSVAGLTPSWSTASAIGGVGGTKVGSRIGSALARSGANALTSVSTVEGKKDAEAGTSGETERQKTIKNIKAAISKEDASKGKEKAMVRFVSNGRVFLRPARNVLRLLGGFLDKKYTPMDRQVLSGSDLETADVIIDDAYDMSVDMVKHNPKAEQRGSFFKHLIDEKVEKGLMMAGVDMSQFQVFSRRSMEEAIKTNSAAATRHCVWNTVCNSFEDQGDKAASELRISELSADSLKGRVFKKVADTYGCHIEVMVSYTEWTQKVGHMHVKKYSGAGANESSPVKKVALLDGHFFPNGPIFPSRQGEPADLTTLMKTGHIAVDTEDPESMKRFSRSCKGSPRFRYYAKQPEFIGSKTPFTIVKMLHRFGYLKPIPEELMLELGMAKTHAAESGAGSREIFTTPNDKGKFFIPDVCETSHKIPKKSVKGVEYDSVWYADFETFPDGAGVHVPYLAAAVPRGCDGQDEAIVSIAPENVARYGTEGYDQSVIGNQLLGSIIERSFLERESFKDEADLVQIEGKAPKRKMKILLMFHNARYDCNFLNTCLMRQTVVEGGSRLYQLRGTKTAFVRGTCVSCEFTIHDSWAFIQSKLSDFPKMFQACAEVGGKWEAFPYEVYNQKRLSERMCGEVFLGFDDEDKYLVGDKTDLYGFAAEYCVQDCVVLQRGFDEFRTATLELGLDVDHFMTVASLSKKYLQKEGALDGVEPIRGSVRAYVQETVIGGRVCVKGNRPVAYDSDEKDRKSRLVDLDAVSQYPSAMALMDGFPIGLPSAITKRPTNGAFYVATVIVTKIEKELNFSTMSKLSSSGGEGVRTWGKYCVKVGDVVVLNSQQIESAEKYQGFEFAFIGGLAWKDGFNKKINSIIRTLFDWRLKLKAENNPLQLTVKLIMNSAYGKLCERPHDVNVRWLVGTEAEAKKTALESGYGLVYLEDAGPVMDFRRGEGKKHWKVKYNSPDFSCENYAHAGSLVLAKSKDMMYEVTTPLDELLLYTDTDSMMLPISALEKISKERPDLIGKEMGQFHTDLQWTKGRVAPESVYVSRARFLGKKTYVLELSSDERPGEFEYQIRAKGIPTNAIRSHCEEEKKKYPTPIEFYERIVEKGYTFDMLKAAPRFKQNPTSIMSVESFTRKLGPYLPF